MHLNYFRERATNGGIKHIPRMAYDTFASKLQAPVATEGFDEIVEVEFAARLDTPQQEALFSQWAA